MATAKPPQPFLSRTWDYITETQIWRSIFRHGMPANNRNRVLVVMSNVFLHLHPVKIRKSGIRLKFTWCMGGLTFFLFLVETFTGLLLMFYYRPTVAYAYMDIIDLAEQVPLGIMREMHRWGAHAMVITVMLHMFRVFLTGSYKPPREFNWNVGVILLVLTLLLSFTGYLLPWDQIAYWAITIGTNMGGYAPFFNTPVNRLLLGGLEVGQNTLLRFYVLHIMFLPLIAAIFLAVHFWRIRKDGGISGPL
jgi:quinol-cytochrome oxidoreductase complex cytochrome b subunit